MSWQKQAFMCFVIIVFVFTLSFYKNVFKRDKGIKIQREEAARQVEIERKNIEKIEELDRKRSEELQKHQELLNRMKEHVDICYDIHVLIFKPEKQEISSNNNNDSMELELKQSVKKTNINKEEESMKLKNSVVSEPVIYLFVLVLIYSLIKAAMDISQHFSKKAEEENGVRRCSLKEYATVKNERRSSKAPLFRRSTVLTMDARIGPLHSSFDERRLSRITSDVNNSGLISEPGTPARVLNGIASRPPPLLRRCSVPAFALQHLGHPTKLRRPSIDSFSEDDSSPDVKRRVRMIHRH